MSDRQKSLAQIAHDGFYGKMAAFFEQRATPTFGKDGVASLCWQAAAEAVRAELQRLDGQK